jgi:malonyl-CoA/methylmalonyl-CoA synthetase
VSTLVERAFAALREGAERELLIGVDESGRRSFAQTGRELLERAGGWQAELEARGVTPGARVMLDLPRGPELLAAHLGALAQGAWIVPVNPSLAPAERARVLERAQPSAALRSRDLPAGSRMPKVRAKDESPALLIFTSGTTGEPKGVPHTHASLEANLDALARTWGLSADDRLLHALPAHHVHGLVLALYGSARLGIPVVLLARFDADRALSAMAEHAVTVFMGVPTMYHRLAHASPSIELFGMRLCVSGSAPLAPTDFRAFEARFGIPPLERYGLTETLIVSSNPLEGERRPGTVGLALPDTELRLAEDGEIEVRGPSVMAGYLEEPAANAEAFREGFFRTGDLGRLDERGYLVISGRKKELILVGGSNVLPGEVEAALADVRGVEELVAAGLPDPDRGEIVALFVVPSTGSDPAALETTLRARAEERLSPYKRPRLYRFLSALPRNALGKVNRSTLASLPDR